ncbi:MAG: SDR family oxidoreductase [Spirochaetes bacterium]|nr:SDR family oxidoreductase [Spirochaetota bacterium]
MSDERVVAIAGASSGVGRAAALRLARSGYAVSLCARRENLLKEIAAEIEKDGGKALAVKADMTKWTESEKFIHRTVDTFGRVDVLFNNAGSGIRFTDFENMSVDEIDEAIAANLTYVLYGCKAVLPVMKRQKSGHIVNTTSILGKRARSGFAAYSAGKHGVDGFSRALFNEVKKYNIKVSILGPALINTDWAKKAGITTPFASGALEPEEVAEALQLLIETSSGYSIWSMDLMSLGQVIDPL